METVAVRPKNREAAIRANRVVLSLSRHWLWAFLFVWGLYVWLPWLAPIFKEAGLETPARVIYAIYSTQCHQLPQRSFFLFGPQPMWSLEQIRAVWPAGNDPLRLREFVGNAEMGYKVAWSDRMVSLYTSIWFGAVVFGLLRGRVRPLRWPWFVLLVLPLALDGTSHFISDLAGIGQGFRDSNAWLAALTNNTLPAWFYAGDALGSFNSWMRLITGVLTGLGVVWFAFPYADQYFQDVATTIEAKFQRAGIAV
ncbi:MAG: hypothetical protein C4310_03350 [Chloroflexota bacterium]